MKRIGIFGTSGMARETGDVARALDYVPVYIARNVTEISSWPYDDEVIPESEVDSHRSLPYVIGVGDNSIREAIAGRFLGRLTFGNLIHPSATFGWRQREAIDAGSGVIICAGVRLTNGISVGNFTILNQNATIAHDAVLADFVHVAPMACISGSVHLDTGVWIGAGAVVNQGTPVRKLSVGARTTVGSGAVVVSDCESDAIYAGVPAKRIK